MSKTNKTKEAAPALDATKAPTNDQLQVTDLLVLVKALQISSDRKVFSEFEIKEIQPAFDRVVGFLTVIQSNQAAAKAESNSEETK